MSYQLSDNQLAIQARAKEIAEQQIAPFAQDYDRSERLPREVIDTLANAGFLGCLVPSNFGGQDYDLLAFGLLNEQLGKACSSVRSLLTVHSMVQFAIVKWGSNKQKDHWLGELASGNKVAAFALSEEKIGSDAAGIQTQATRQQHGYVLDGQKKWISFGQIADVFLVIAQVSGKPIACLVERDTPGLTVEPITGMLGCKASMLATITFDGCVIPKEQVIGGLGFGFSAIALSALDIGRYSVASGCVGIAQACLDVCGEYVKQRQQFGQHLSEFQLIRRHLADMRTHTKAARLLYYHSAYLKEQEHPSAATEIMRAKYYAGQIANDITRQAIQILGASGYSESSPLERYFRDAKAMEIIEGSNEILQLVLGGDDSYGSDY